jgi:hypothetical protein
MANNTIPFLLTANKDFFSQPTKLFHSKGNTSHATNLSDSITTRCFGTSAINEPQPE